MPLQCALPYIEAILLLTDNRKLETAVNARREEGEIPMAESRGKKSKKAQWQLSLGVKEFAFTMVGIIGLVMMSFALGTLAGRGDIYRVLHNWGLVGAEAPKGLQPWNPPQAGFPPIPPAAPPIAPNSDATLTMEAPVNPALPAPQQGSIVAPPTAKASAAPAKKARQTATSPRKTREEELKRMKEDVAKKLKFQNSLDTGTYKPAKAKEQKAKVTAKAPAAKSVSVGKYRDKKAAQAKVAELQKKGEKVSLKEGKDKQGAFYTVYRQQPPGSAPAPSVAQNKAKNAGTKSKTKGQ